MDKPKFRKVDDNSANDMVSFPPDTYERPRSDFTCMLCGCVAECPCAYDWYNVDGDCLELK